MQVHKKEFGGNIIQRRVSKGSNLAVYAFCVSILFGLQISSDTTSKIEKSESLAVQDFLV